jgi:hypothetical protein
MIGYEALPLWQICSRPERRKHLAAIISAPSSQALGLESRIWKKNLIPRQHYKVRDSHLKDTQASIEASPSALELHPLSCIQPLAFSSSPEAAIARHLVATYGFLDGGYPELCARRTHDGRSRQIEHICPKSRHAKCHKTVRRPLLLVPSNHTCNEPTNLSQRTC